MLDSLRVIFCGKSTYILNISKHLQNAPLSFPSFFENKTVSDNDDWKRMIFIATCNAAQVMDEKQTIDKHDVAAEQHVIDR